MTIPPGIPAPGNSDNTHSSIQVDAKQVLNLVVDIAKDIWRLKRSLTRLNQQESLLNQEIISNITRLEDDLGSANIEIYDMDGLDHQPGSKYTISHIEEGEGDLFVSETLIPGVRWQGQTISNPTVVLGHRGGQL